MYSAARPQINLLAILETLRRWDCISPPLLECGEIFTLSQSNMRESMIVPAIVIRDHVPLKWKINNDGRRTNEIRLILSIGPTSARPQAAFLSIEMRMRVAERNTSCASVV